MTLINRPFLTSFIFLLAFLFSGCGHKPAPFLPQDARQQTIEAVFLEDNPNQAVLQIIIIYGPQSCNHTALRVFSPQKGAIFWDPAGYYGIQGTITAQRNNDLLVDDAPSINQYIFFRTETEFPSKVMELFEWNIKPAKADQLIRILKNSAKPAIPGQNRFTTKGTGLYCGNDISNFLSQAATEIMTVDQTFFPHDLEQRLYTQSPDRVILVDFDQPIHIRQILLKKNLSEPRRSMPIEVFERFR